MRTRRREFLDEMEKVVPWADLVALVSPYLLEGKRGRTLFSPETMLRILFMQQRFALSDPSMEEALHHMSVFREYPGFEGWGERPPDSSTLLRLRHVLEKHKLAAQFLQTINDLLSAKGVMLKSGTVLDATLIATPGSSKNSAGERDPEMKRSRKGQHWYFGLKCQIGVDDESGLVHTVEGTSGAVNDVLEANSLVHPSAPEDYVDAGYQGNGKWLNALKAVNRHSAKARTSAALSTWQYRWMLRPSNLNGSMPESQPRRSARSECSSTASVMPRQTTMGWPSTRHNCTPCFRWPISGWCAENGWEPW